jgi:hypothetical protein
MTMVLLIDIGCVPQSRKTEMGIKFKEETYDFGTHDEGQNLEHDFLFVNTGERPLRILDVKPNCSCTVVDDWDENIVPAQIGKIPVTLKTTGYQGNVIKTIIVKTDVPNSESITLTVKANVNPAIAIVPGNVFLGEIPPEYNVPLYGSFEIDNRLEEPLRILEIRPPDDRTEFKLTTLERNNKYKVDFTVNPPFAGETMVRGEFRIKTDNKDHPEIIATYSYFIPPPLLVWPTAVDIDLDQFKDYVIPFITTINIKSTMDKPIRIRGLKLIGGKGIKYEILEATRDLFYQILITVPLNYAYHKDEKVYFVFSVLNDPKNKEYNIPVRFAKTETSRK